MATVEDMLMRKGPDVIIAAPDNTAHDAAKMMCQAGVGAVIIKDADELAGIFTERDLLCRVVTKGKDPGTTPLAEVMSSPVKTCGIDDTIASVGEIMASQHVRHIAVVEGNALIGVIGLRDVLAGRRDEQQ